MNICILTSSTLAHQMGGTEVHCAELSKLAAELGHSVEIITTRHPKQVEIEEIDSSRTHYLNNTRPARLNKAWWKESSAKIEQLNRQKPIDIIWAENFSGFYYAYRARPELKIPIISIFQVPGILEYILSEWRQVSTPKEFFDFTIKRLTEAVFCYTRWYSKTLKYSDAIVGISEYVNDSLRKEFGVNPKKFSLIYDGIDAKAFCPDIQEREKIRLKLRLKTGDKLILMAGRLHKQKGMHLGLKAFLLIKKTLPNAKMLIIGDGPQQNELKEMAQRFRVTKDVIFYGFVPNFDMRYYYNAADLFLNPTLRVEGLAIVLLEAMSCCLPVITSRMGGTASTINDGESGFFVNPKDLNRLAEKSVKILSDQGLSGRMGENGRKKVLEKFTREKMAVDFLSLSKNLIEKGVNDA